MKRTAFSFLLMALSWSVAHAMRDADPDLHAYPQVLVVEVTDGGKSVFALASKPTVTFEGIPGSHHALVKIANAETSVEYPCTEIVKCYFISEKEIHDGVEQARTKDMIVRQPSKYVYVIEGVPATEVQVADISGRACSQCISPMNGGVRIDLTSTPQGIYIIHFGKGQSIKILRRHD
ncbi:MAG: T9SS type A sorting domain-containing protein [Prevotella sp.]|nr:T9SS type A sorting domain-containing protein [Prevotella sp.]